MTYNTAVHFRCRATVNFGDKVVVVGSTENLGKWEFKACHELVASNTAEDVWNSSYPAYLPLKEYVEYRYAVLNEKNEFVRWNDELVRHIEPTGNEMLVEDDEGYFRSECSSHSHTSPKFNKASHEDRLPNFKNEQSEPSPESLVYFVTSRLPVQVYRKLDGTFGIRDSNTPLTAMLWELRNRFRNKMKFVGACCIRIETEQELNEQGLCTSTNAMGGVGQGTKDQFTEEEQHEIRKLLSSYGCIPVFIPFSEMSSSVKFCKKYMWNLFYNIGLWDIYEQDEFDWDLWQSYCKVNKYYATAVSQYLGRNDFTWVHDYKLLMVPHFLSRKCKTANIGLFMHALFPSYTLFACLAVREEVLRSMLCADLIGFHFFEFAKHFLTSCKRILGLDYNFSTGGMIFIEYNGRQVMIRMNQVHIQSDLLESKVANASRVQLLAHQLRRDWPDRFIVASVDRDVRLSGLLLKFKAFRRFLHNYPYARGKILLVQYICMIDTLWQGNSDVSRKLMDLASMINKEFETTHIVLKINASYEEKYSLFMASDCFMDTSIRGGINLCAFEYVYCRKGKPALSIISEFTGFSKTLVSAIRVNPWHTDSVMEALDSAMSLNTDYAAELCRKDVAYIEANQAIAWVDQFIRELYYSRKSQDMLHTSWGFGKTYKTLSFATNFQLLDFDLVLSKFENSKRKLLFLDCEGTLCFNPYDVESRFYQSHRETRSVPLQVNIDSLKKLSRDKNTVIVLISSRTVSVMDEWFHSLPNVGLCAERGYHFKLPSVFGHEWQTINQTNYSHLSKRGQDMNADEGNPSDNWRVVAVKLFEQYVQRTPGSCMESKDSCVVFMFQNSDQEFGMLQANELNSTLSLLMDGFPVDIHRGKGYLEVRLKGVNKGNSLLHVVNKYSSIYGDFDFILCLGDDRSDEESFRALEALKRSHPPTQLQSPQSTQPGSTKLGPAKPDKASQLSPAQFHPPEGTRQKSGEKPQRMDSSRQSGGHPATSTLSTDSEQGSSEKNAVKDSYISCIVGKRPSKANYYLNDYLEVANLLSALANHMD
ncbi:trehalose-6-phosphate synthase [Theileria orientalis strain Shintoku]|uniref:Trehalose-6-phosphate synthase n=1 Tax=Theileria orientalis strain Shintoku TaxID=869250 RepID=J4CCB5_THEOR|nr:trehalose-6-phosphate synthase [Theileria orientalis strain Shintoku]BAM39102.1 trehalose-6-phosphate synthase [Theileria orientalis strain Shintoku]|eukprot:XP_009689403.1 trehalose-6-phosphate synthase [Theileria orientalis strain Shintoku]